jgi:hypothetical protein
MSVNGQRVFEYEATCGTCGKTFRLGLTVPADSIDEASLAQLVDAIHGPSCTVDVSTGDRV